MKLLSGGLFDEIDYADETYTRVVKFFGVEWAVSSDLNVCPLGTYKGSDAATCFRDGV